MSAEDFLSYWRNLRHNFIDLTSCRLVCPSFRSLFHCADRLGNSFLIMEDNAVFVVVGFLNLSGDFCVVMVYFFCSCDYF